MSLLLSLGNVLIDILIMSANAMSQDMKMTNVMFWRLHPGATQEEKLLILPSESEVGARSLVRHTNSSITSQWMRSDFQLQHRIWNYSLWRVVSLIDLIKLSLRNIVLHCWRYPCQNWEAALIRKIETYRYDASWPTRTCLTWKDDAHFY